MARPLILHLVAALLFLPTRAAAEVVNLPVLVAGHLWSPWVVLIASAATTPVVRVASKSPWLRSTGMAATASLVALIGCGLAGYVYGALLGYGGPSMAANILMAAALCTAIQAGVLRGAFRISISRRTLGLLLAANLVPLIVATILLVIRDHDLLDRLRSLGG